MSASRVTYNAHAGSDQSQTRPTVIIYLTSTLHEEGDRDKSLCSRKDKAGQEWNEGIAYGLEQPKRSG